MSLRKRLRVLWAALTQSFEVQTCPTCGTTWYCQSGLCAGQDCATCEAKTFETWARQQGEAA